MKKILFATTAIVAAGLTTSANAAEWETGVSGYYFLGMAYADNDTQGDVGVLRDGEFHINGSLTADNGLVFAARVEVESFTTGDQIDENWGAVRGSFGRIKIGGDDSAINAYQNGIIYAPGARIGYYDAFNLTEAASAMSQNGGNFDAIGIHYDSPNFMGFQVGATFIPDLGADSGGDLNGPSFAQQGGNDNYYSVGANYQGDFGDFGFGISGGYANADGPSNEIWNVGGNISFGGFTVAGGYQDAENGGILTTFQTEGDVWHVGAQYATGPWTVAGGYSNNSDTDVDVAAGWVTYALAPGVLLTGGVEYGDNGPEEDFGVLGFMTLRF